MSSVGSLGALLYAQGKLQEAKPLLRDALAWSRQVLGDTDPNTLNSLNNYLSLLREQGRLRIGKHEPLMREALAINRQLYGNDHPKALQSSFDLGVSLLAIGKVQEA